MAGVNTQVKLTDGMSKVLRSMNKALNLVLDSFNELQEVSNESINTSNIEEARIELQRAAVEAYNLEEGMQDAGYAIDRANEGFTTMDAIVANIVGNGISNLARTLMQQVGECVDGFDEELFGKNQLRAVLANMVGSEYEEAYDRLVAKASEIQSKGMYGDEAMIGGAAEFATYFEDTNAIEVMMDTLADYVAGMTGGGAVSKTAMVDYATGLGKIMTGSYEAMTKKGFKFTETQKAIIEGTATEAEIVQTLGEEYLNAGHEMQAAMTIQQVIGESWENLYSTMSDTPRGKIISLNNTIGDIKETVAAKLYPKVLEFVDYLNNNMPKIESGIDTIATILGFVLDITIKIVEFVGDHGDLIISILAGITAATIGWRIAQLLLNGALYACPLVWIIGLIGVLIGLLIQAANQCGGFSNWWNMAWLNMQITTEKVISSILLGIQKIINACIDAGNMIFDLYNKATGIEVGQAAHVTFGSDYAEKSAKKVDELQKKYDEALQKAVQGDDIKDSYDAYEEYLAKFNPDDLSSGMDDIVENTGNTAKALEITDEDLKYLRDIAEQEAINRFTTAEIKIDMQNNNNISSDMDIDGIVSTLEDRLYESMTIAAEGAY